MISLRYLLIAAFLLLTGCWEPGVHIGGPYSSAPDWMLGKWSTEPDYEGKTKTFNLTTTTDGETVRIDDDRVYVVKIGQNYFLSVDSKGGSGLFDHDRIVPVAVRQNPNGTISYALLSEKIKEKFTDSQALREFISQNMHLSFFYENWTTLTRPQSNHPIK